MNIMRHKTVKFITQLRHAMQWRTIATQAKYIQNTKYQLISQPKYIDKF